MSRKNKLMAVPPFNASCDSADTNGMVSINSATRCRKYSDRAIEVARNGYQIFGIELAAFDKHAFSRAQIDLGLVYLL
jgi:hypothetical protein